MEEVKRIRLKQEGGYATYGIQDERAREDIATIRERVEELDGNVTVKVNPASGTFYRHGEPCTDNWCEKFVADGIAAVRVETTDAARKFNLREKPVDGIYISSGQMQGWRIVAPDGYRIKGYRLSAVLRTEGQATITASTGQEIVVTQAHSASLNVTGLSTQETTFMTTDSSTIWGDRQIWILSFEIYVERTDRFALKGEVDEALQMAKDYADGLDNVTNSRIDALGSVYKVKGSSAWTVSDPTSALMLSMPGDVWNITEAFTLGGKSYPAGTNVVCIASSMSTPDYNNRFDALAGEIDLSGFYTKTEVDARLDDKQDIIDDLSNIRSGAQDGSTAIQPDDEDYTELQGKVADLDDTAVKTGSYDATVAVGLADNLRGDTIVDAEFYKRKTGGTQSVGSGIAAIKEIRGKSIVWNQLLKEGYLVDMGLPSGTLWASRNIDITQEDGFAASPFQYECSFFSWGNIDGHNPSSVSAFDYNWGGVNETEPYYEGQPYGSTPGNTLTGNIAVGEDFDAARANLGAPWRMPTSAEFAELFANIIYIDANGDEVDTTKADKRVSVNGVLGLYIQSKLNGARLFFSCSGYGAGRSWNNRGSYGHYWSSTFNSARLARFLNFYSGGVRPQNGNARYLGFALRPVLTHKLTSETDGNGHKFIQYGDNITDLTIMYGAGNEPASVEDFVKLYPLNRYTYNKGEIIPFAGQSLVTIGKNQYNPATGKANLLGGQTYQLLGTYTSATIDEVAVTLDSNNCFTTTKDCVLEITGGNDTDTFVGLYDGETNTYEPYEKHTLSLDPSQWRDKQGNLVFPYGGMHGVGITYDYAKVDADGYIRKAVRMFERRAYESGDTELANVITDGSTYTFYPLETPVEVELATPIYAKYLVDKDGTEEITPANGTTPYTAPANLSILYAMDARGEIKNLPKGYLSKESAENMLNAMVAAGVIQSYTMTYDDANARYQFTFVKA